MLSLSGCHLKRMLPLSHVMVPIATPQCQTPSLQSESVDVPELQDSSRSFKGR